MKSIRNYHCLCLNWCGDNKEERHGTHHCGMGKTSCQARGILIPYRNIERPSFASSRASLRGVDHEITIRYPKAAMATTFGYKMGQNEICRHIMAPHCSLDVTNYFSYPEERCQSPALSISGTFWRVVDQYITRRNHRAAMAILGCNMPK